MASVGRGGVPNRLEAYHRWGKATGFLASVGRGGIPNRLEAYYYWGKATVNGNGGLKKLIRVILKNL